MAIQGMRNAVKVPGEDTNVNQPLTHNSSPGEQGGNPAKQQEQYLNTLFSPCSEGYIEVRVLSIDWKVTDRQWHPVKAVGTLNLPINEHIFLGVATRQENKGTKDAIVQIPAVWGDIDFKDIARDEVERRIAVFPVKPSIVVSSGHGLHLYWILDNPSKIGDIQKIEDINKRLVNHFGGDKGSADAAHILRLPGTYNHKYNPPRLVSISSINDKTYCIDDFYFLPPIQPPALPMPLPQGSVEEWHTQILRGVSKGERHTSAVRLAGRYRTLGLTENETQQFMAKWNEKNIPPLTNAELSGKISDVYGRYRLERRSQSAEAGNVVLQDFTSVIESSVMRVHEFMHKTLPVKPYIINPLLKKGELIMVSAGRGVGKTWFGLSLGYMATRQSTIGNWKTSTPTETLYIDGEMSEDEMQDRLFTIKLGRQAEQASFYLLSSDEMRSNDKKSPNLNNPSWRNSISEYLKSHPDIGLIILDNLASLTPGRDENKKRDWDDINEWFLELRSKGVAVMFLHHEGKGGEQRGTSAIEDNINFSIRLKHPVGYRREDGAKFVVEFIKSRRLYGDDAKSFTLQLQNTGSGLDWEVIADEANKIEDQIINMWREGVKQKNIAEALGVTPSWVSQVLKKAKEEEKAKRMEMVFGNDEDQAEDSPHTEEVEVVERQD